MDTGQSLVSLAQENETQTRDLCRALKLNFIEIGRLLNQNYENSLWSLNQWGSFRDYVESLGIGSYSWVTRLMSIASLVDMNVISEPEALEIGVGKMALLIPRLREGDLSLIDIAKDCPVSDLKQELGHKDCIPPDQETIRCPRCGAEFRPVGWRKR